MDNQILVAVGIIERDGKYLVTQRPENGKHNSLKWEFLGGTKRKEETLEECVEREIREEVGIKVRALGEFGRSSHAYVHNGVIKQIELVAFHCEYISGEPQKKKTEIHDLKWVRREELGSYDFSQAAVPLVGKLINS